MTGEVPGPELQEAAAQYAGLGWPVFPCQERGKVPCKAEGLIEHGVLDAKRSPFWVKQFWGRWPHANVGVAAGEGAGWWVLDADIDQAAGKDGFATLALLQDLFGEALPETLGQSTPSGGRHWLFKWPGHAVPNSASKRLGPGLDTRGDGGYIVVGPSIHPNGGRYRWSGDPAATPIAAAPDWLLRLLVGGDEDLEWCRARVEGKTLPAWLAKRLDKPQPVSAARPLPAGGVHPYARAALEDECKTVRQTLPGNQNNALNEAAFKLGTLVGGGHLPEGLARQHLMAAALAWSWDPKRGPWKPEKLAKIIDSGLTAGAKEPRDLPPPPARGGLGSRRGGRAGAGGMLRLDPERRGEAVERARTLWRSRQALERTPAARWLAAERIDPAGPGGRGGWPVLGFVPALTYEVAAAGGGVSAELGRWPALVAPMARWGEDTDGRPLLCGVLALWLADDGRPAHIVDGGGTAQRAMRGLGDWWGAAVRLSPLGGDRLLLATGLAVGLRARMARPDLPVWVAGSLSAMAGLVLPPSIAEVVVLGAERAGDEARARTRHALARGGRAVGFGDRTAARAGAPWRATG
ncbi:bifunctional DNA primase/polymerase [Azospirillum sp. ST 5-10]|uniref:bifunctional DNA primase/polymerase n=1 Tax=unclassified Azospirillum TaxID=2630922 RepID=UPI003F4A1C1C